MGLSRNKLIIGCCALGGHALNLIPFSYGMFLPYVYSYLYSLNPDVEASQMHIHAPLCLTAATGTAWTFGIFQKYVNPHILHILNGLALSMWLVVLYFCSGSYVMITCAIALIGFHSGQLHVYFSQRVTEEGRQYPSTANGVYGFLFGLAGIWGSIMSGGYINPWSIQPTILNSSVSSGSKTYVFTDSRILERVPNNWLIIALITFVFLLPGYFTIYKVTDQQDAGEREKLLETSSSSSEEKEKGDVMEISESDDTDQSVFSMTGLALFLTTIGIGVSSMCAFDLFKDYGLKKIRDDTFLNVAGIFIPIVGAFGRIMWGALGDKVSLKVLFVSGNVLSVILQVLMYPTRCNKFSYVINTCILSIMPGMMTLLPPSVKKFMGNKNIALKYGIVLTGEVIGCVYYLTLSSLVRSYLNDIVLVLLMGIPAVLANIPALLFIKERKRTQLH